MSHQKILYTVLCSIASLFIVIFVAKSASSDGRIDYCYMDHASSNGGYIVYGHRPWRMDVQIGVADSPESANVITSRSVFCPEARNQRW